MQCVRVDISCAVACLCAATCCPCVLLHLPPSHPRLSPHAVPRLLLALKIQQCCNLSAVYVRKIHTDKLRPASVRAGATVGPKIPDVMHAAHCPGLLGRTYSPCSWLRAESHYMFKIIQSHHIKLSAALAFSFAAELSLPSCYGSKTRQALRCRHKVSEIRLQALCSHRCIEQSHFPAFVDRPSRVPPLCTLAPSLTAQEN